jgi:hypothetical protein
MDDNKTLRVVGVVGWTLAFIVAMLGVARQGYLHSDSEDLVTTPVETVAPTNYVERGKIIDTTDNTTTIVTSDGYEWEITDDRYKVGQVVNVTFSDEGTTSVYDDRIVSVDAID